jgi:hypothetical protein
MYRRGLCRARRGLVRAEGGRVTLARHENNARPSQRRNGREQAQNVKVLDPVISPRYPAFRKQDDDDRDEHAVLTAAAFMQKAG